MRKDTVGIIIDLVFIVLLCLVLLKGCKDEEKKTQMDQATITRIMQQNFDSLANNQVKVIVSEIEPLEQLLSQTKALTVHQSSLLSRLLGAEKAIAAQNAKLNAYAEIIAQTKRETTSTVYVIDTTGKVQYIPDTLRTKRMVVSSQYSDEWTTRDITWDMSTDSITADIVTNNHFTIKQFTNESGEQLAQIDNLNPYTFTQPGTNVFQLELPEKVKRRRFSLGLQLGYYYTKEGLRPGVGAGLSYDIGQNIEDLARLVKRSVTKEK